MRRLTLLTLLLAAGCSPEAPCTAIGTPVGVSLHIAAPLAAEASAATMEVCWDGACKQVGVELRPSTRAARETCSGDSCRADEERTGEKNGFGDVAGLPKRPVTIRLTLHGAGAKPLLERRLEVTPKGRFPNGPECGEGGPNVVLTVAADGSVQEG
ncbi:hypothetical protein ABT120_58630 [Nonomuraea angiospora]|uniref:hypothetical protein n=1 Tax=Nonomuraea angiospora TaxID=46172 RepID=UPI003317D1B9